MSWDSYIDKVISYSGECCDKVAIIDKDGPKWTTDDHEKSLRITDEEAKVIAECFKKKNFERFYGNGVVIEDVKYYFVREDEGKSVMAKKKGKGSITLIASKTAIVIGHTPEGNQQGKTNQGVTVIADYLESLCM